MAPNDDAVPLNQSQKNDARRRHAVKALFFEAVRIDKNERVAFLDRAAHKEIDRLIRQHEAPFAYWSAK